MREVDSMKYDDWVNTLPTEITSDALWKVEAYRLALFASDVGWLDITKLMGDKRTVGLSDQLYRSLGSIGANLAEGYSRGSHKDRARFYEYSLGSARESRDWYYKARHVLGNTVSEHRIRFITQIVRLLLTMVPQQRGYTLHEEKAIYRSDLNDLLPPDQEIINSLLQNVPLP